MLAGGEICRTSSGWKPLAALMLPDLMSSALWPFHTKPSFSVTVSALQTTVAVSLCSLMLATTTCPAVPPTTRLPSSPLNITFFTASRGSSL